MSRFAVTVAVVVALVVAALGAWWLLMRSGARGGDTHAAETHALPSFHQIAVDGDADVTLVQDGSESIAISVAGTSIVHAEVRDGALVIHSSDERRWWSSLLGAGRRRVPQVTVTFRAIDALRASGAVRLAAERLRADALALHFSGAATLAVPALDAQSLAIDGSGAFKASVGGRVDEQRVTISGAADYRAGDLVSERASILVSGAGRVVVNAQKTLDVDLSGAGKVDYKGDPKITQRVSGAARIRRLESALSPPTLARSQ